jgi:transcriptional regulator with XRE-family HTH domain
MTPQQKLAAKLREAMSERGMKKAELAQKMGVKTPSVYDWLKYGRIAKDRLPALVDLFGKPLPWWFGDDEEPVEPLEKQLLTLYRALSPDFQERLLADANKLHSYENPDPSPSNPYPNAPRLRKPQKGEP